MQGEIEKNIILFISDWNGYIQLKMKRKYVEDEIPPLLEPSDDADIVLKRDIKNAINNHLDSMKVSKFLINLFNIV